MFQRNTDPVVSGTFTSIRKRFGDPAFGFSFIPRPVSRFSAVFATGGRFGSRHFGVDRDFDDRPIFLSFYFGYYFDDPFFLGFWYPGYYPSAYCYYGWVPRWCYPPGLVVYDVDPYPIYIEQPPYYYLARPRLDEEGVAAAIADLRAAWLNSDIDRLAYYLRPDEKISVYFDGKYSYSLARDDYYTMTLDAMSTIRTEDMVFDDPIWLNSSEVYVSGRHTFDNMNKQSETVYVSYRLHRYGGRWYIIEVGSSPKPTKTDYHDFRYRY